MKISINKHVVFEKAKGYFCRFMRLNCEAKIGLFLLTPPAIGVVFFLMTILGINNSFLKDGQYDFKYDFSERYRNYESKWYGWNYVDTGKDTSTPPIVPIYLGFMAIAGAYLIKGNLNK